VELIGTTSYKRKQNSQNINLGDYGNGSGQCEEIKSGRYKERLLMLLSAIKVSDPAR
jgi:hypothetical protein